MTNAALLRLIQQFMEFNSQGTEKEFAQWLYGRYFSLPTTTKGPNSEDRMLAYLLQRVGRLGRFFGKKPMAKHGLSSIDDFLMLNTIFHKPGIAKKVLYEECVTEISTGSQIIKRLVRQGLIKETISPNDKRVTLLALTNKGTSIRNQCFEGMLEEVLFKFEPLSREEKKTMIAVLEKLDIHLTKHFLEAQVV